MLHDNDQKFILILDPAIPSEAGDDYYPASSGLAQNIFVTGNRFFKLDKYRVVEAGKLNFEIG